MEGGRERGKDWETHYTCHEFPFPKQMQIFKLHSRQSPPSAKSRSNRFWHGLPPRHAQLFMRSTIPPHPLTPASSLARCAHTSFNMHLKSFVLQTDKLCSTRKFTKTSSTKKKTNNGKKRIIEAKVGEMWERRDMEGRETESTEAGTSK